MKTFRQLSILDKVYYCKRNDVEYNHGGVSQIIPKGITFNFSGANARSMEIEGDLLDCGRLVSKHGVYSSCDVLVFTLESEAIRYCKTNLIKELRNKISKVKGYIQEVVKFRLDNIDHLNKDWIESEILKLEKMEREIL